MFVFDDTKTMTADLYLDYMGYKTTRKDLLQEAREGWVIVMAYVGGGYVPLRVAVGTVSTNPQNPDYCSACSAMQEYFANHRPDELDDDGDLPEELILQVYPREEGKSSE